MEKMILVLVVEVFLFFARIFVVQTLQKQNKLVAALGTLIPSHTKLEVNSPISFKNVVGHFRI